MASWEESKEYQKLKASGLLIDLNWILERITSPDNWTDDFFEEVSDYYSENFNAIRNTLTKAGMWEKFDTAFCEWKNPGQIALLEPVQEVEDKKEIKAVCDNGKSRPVKSANFHLANASQVKIKEPEWLIPGYIPKYGITTIAGEGGVGKTSLWCSIVAAVTTGKPHFLVEGLNIPFQCNPENVVVFSAEDSWEYVLKKRLEANGADMNRIFYIGTNDERFVDLNFDGDLLKGIIETNRPDLVIYDPVQAFVPANLRMGDRNAMRKCFTPLIGFGEMYKTTSIIIAHANKQSGVWGRKRIADSSDIWDSSRSVLMTGMVPNSDGLRYITHEKSNWGKLEDSVLYELNGGAPIFKGYTKKKDRDFIQDENKYKSTVSAAEDAKNFILETLQEKEQMEVKELEDLAVATGISKHALKDAKADLKKDKSVRVWSIGFNPKKFFITLTDTGKAAEYE